MSTSRRHLRQVLIALMLVFATLLACALPSPTTRPASPTPTGAVAPPTAEAEPAPAAEADFVFIDEQPPPASMVEMLEASVIGGAWTYEQGLIAGLQVLAGEALLTDAFGESPLTGEGTGILNLAFFYLESGTDPAAKAEIERLLAIVAPSPERLLEYAEPEGAQAHRPAGLSAARQSTAEECQSFFEKGFPGFPAGQKVLCLLYKEQTLGGYQARIFYPSWWTSSDPQWPYLDAAHQAVAASWNMFSTFGEMRAIDLVFTVLGDKEDPDTVAVAPGLGGAKTCQIAIYPGALKAFPANDQMSGVALGDFKQIVAHEMFHCFQSIRFPAHAWNVVDWGINDWWGEASADYFSNLVYPTVNLEWRTAPEFATKSTTLPIFNMSYANSVFFQHMANTLGNAAILDLIGSLPPNSLAGQQAVLAGYDGMDAFWHEFGRLYLEGRIPDTSGPFLPSLWPTGISVTITAPGAKVEVGALPFTLARQILTFKNAVPHKKGWLYQTTVGEAGPTGRNRRAADRYRIPVGAVAPDHLERLRQHNLHLPRHHDRRRTGRVRSHDRRQGVGGGGLRRMPCRDVGPQHPQLRRVQRGAVRRDARVLQLRRRRRPVALPLRPQRRHACRVRLLLLLHLAPGGRRVWRRYRHDRADRDQGRRPRDLLLRRPEQPDPPSGQGQRQPDG